MDSRASESASVAFCFWWRPWKATSVMSVDMKDPYIVLCESTPKKSKRRFSELHETLSIICREIAIHANNVSGRIADVVAHLARSTQRLRARWYHAASNPLTASIPLALVRTPRLRYNRNTSRSVISDCLTLPSSTFPFGRTCTVHSRFTTRDGSVLPSLLVLVSRSEPPRLKSAPDAIERDAAGPWSPAGKLVGENSIPQVSSARSTKIASGSVSAMVGAGSLGAGVGGAFGPFVSDRSARRNVLTFTVIRRRWRGNLEIRVGLCQE
ncbi:hypothetical protein KC365_g81 [Hortaea werneckii]|nr:hypothetical protein KC365_g81 [Hortaea werneckii]